MLSIVYETIYFIRLLSMVPESYIRTRFPDPGGQKVMDPNTKKISYSKFAQLHGTWPVSIPSPHGLCCFFNSVYFHLEKKKIRIILFPFQPHRTGSFVKTSHVRYIR